MSARPKSISTESLWFKLLITGWILTSFWVCYVLIVWLYWETVKIDCKPNPQEITCNIRNEYSPIQTTIKSIPKAQLAAAKIILQTGRRPLSRVVLIGIDRQELPLTTHWGGSVTAQLKQEIDRINSFITDPQSETLTIETRRDIPLQAIPIVGFLTLLNMVLVKKAWTGFK